MFDLVSFISSVAFCGSLGVSVLVLRNHSYFFLVLQHTWRIGPHYTLHIYYTTCMYIKIGKSAVQRQVQV